jgi:hypothetical protein
VVVPASLLLPLLLHAGVLLCHAVPVLRVLWGGGPPLLLLHCC